MTRIPEGQDWTAKRVVVTGAGGFIGSHLTEALVHGGATVTAVVRYNSRRDEGNLRFAEPAVRRALRVEHLELTDIDAVRRVVRDAQVVFNLAAFVGIPYSYQNPQDAVTNNVLSTLNVLLAAREFGVEKLVQTSTSEVYGSARQIPIPETHPLQPQSPYSASKIATDNISLSFWHTYGLPVAVIRPFNTYGPRQSARAVLPSVIAQALAGRDIRVGTTSTTRDFNYVDDTVRGFLMVAGSPATNGEVLNIGSGREVAIDAAIRTIVELVGRHNRIVADDARIRPETSEVSRLCADLAKAERLIGYRPQVSFEEGLRRTIAWIADHAGVFDPATYAV
jgi:dTDP-glucose 4,6-dehydratase